MARGRGIVGSPIERLAARRQEDGHRPAAVPRQRLYRLHVEGVEVGALLAIDLDRHEQVVDQGGGRLVLERLVGHDVAPVAGRIADREEDRLVLGPREGERLLAPRIPIDRVVPVLEQIGARLVGEVVRHQVPPCGRESANDWRADSGTLGARYCGISCRQGTGDIACRGSVPHHRGRLDPAARPTFAPRPRPVDDRCPIRHSGGRQSTTPAVRRAGRFTMSERRRLRR